jgi:uncharacterized protein
MFDTIDNVWIFLFLLPVVAFLYAAVGHGGASGYLALMALFSFPIAVMRPTALLLNLFVAGTAFIQYYKKDHFNWKLFYPFVITSIPFAFIGGYMSVDASLYKKILGVILLFSILRMVGLLGVKKTNPVPVKLWQGLIIGAVIGLISGMIGIGGGIILSPVILLLGWAKMKTTAAVSALFIWVNSAAAMTGLFVSGININPQAFLLVGIALAGGLAGGYYGSGKFNNTVLNYMLAAVLVIACIKLFLT